MKAYARLLISILAAVVLAASLASLYIHYQLIYDPLYSSFCDVNASVSCQQVFTSSYGTVFGIPVAAGGAIWSGLVLLLALGGLGTRNAEARARVGGYIFLLSTVGLASVFYFAYASFVVLQQACPLCMTMYAGVIGIFLVSAGIAGPLASLPARAGEDLAGLRRDATAATLAVVWVVASLGLVLMFPREQVASAAEPIASAAPAPMETIAPEDLAVWHRWLDTQTQADEALPTGDTQVLVMKFNDYQCPACRQTWLLYKDVFDKWEASHPDVFSYQSRDFPLETECGFGGQHLGACEAAVAVRLASGKGLGREMETWLFDHQSTLSRDTVKQGLREVAQITDADFDEQYATVLEDVRADAQLGSRLGVSGTPTFYLNGIQLPNVRPVYLDEAIAHKLRKAGVDVGEPGAPGETSEASETSE